ncbi:MAG: AAA family ATPase [Candidatus Cellulosilyticum pullistercoris]|uniref:endopeptidase La n=1 Tax=Candidatus Cellulosilyticum pullistercoris TaxID=2838521 RepID=A0A9E2KB08_9FIRM|nr:AAA family ATPase [Candidatus Cellulosilyticum pullistercoris]
MNSNKELSWDDLNHSYQPSDFSFANTDEVESAYEILGQEDAFEAIRRGLRIKSNGYNMYICEANNRRIDQVIMNEVKSLALTESTPMAAGYIYNFHHPEEPLLVELRTKDARMLQEDLEELSAFIINDIPLLLETEEVRSKQDTIIEEFELIKEKCFLEIEEKAQEYQMISKKYNEGIHFAPLDQEGKVISKKDFLQLPLAQQNELMEKIILVQAYADDLIAKLVKQEKLYLEMYDEVEQEVVLKEIGAVIKRLKEKYEQYPRVQNYLNDLAQDILEHLQMIVRSESSQLEAKKDIASLLIDQGREKLVRNYGLNLVCLPNEEGAPVINDYDYPQLSLTGKILLDTENNMISSDYTLIRPGLLHYANGGYLILHMQELLERANGWQNLKRVLRTGTIRVEGNEELGLSLVRPIKPEQMKAHLKVILIGSQQFYEVLSSYDEEFKELFKIKVNMKEEIGCDKERIEQLARVIKGISKEEGILPVSTEGLLTLVSLGNRQTDHPKRIPGNIDRLIDILREAQVYAKGQIEAKDIEEGIKKRQKYESYLQERLDESINDATYLLDTKGERIGQVNGLAVYNIGELTFGRPIRITATTYRGQQGIVDIENEAKLSGSIHTKGIHIITGFLGNQFAQEFPLSLSCNICFEQSYGPIDGDSASSAELYAILSSLSERPIKQNIAVTGSINQFGEIQPIGGVNEKIEGFFKVCEQRGLSGDEGVIIPNQNTKELLLASEVIEAVKNNKFHIYAINHVWEGVEIIMGTEKEKVISEVQEKLRKYNV